MHIITPDRGYMHDQSNTHLVIPLVNALCPRIKWWICGYYRENDCDCMSVYVCSVNITVKLYGANSRFIDDCPSRRLPVTKNTFARRDVKNVRS